LRPRNDIEATLARRYPWTECVEFRFLDTRYWDADECSAALIEAVVRQNQKGPASGLLVTFPFRSLSR